VSELISINLDDINFTQKAIRIVGKGNKERTVYFSDYCKKQIEDYLAIRDKETIDKKEPLFLNDKKERFTRYGIYHICKIAFELIGVGDKHYSPHTLRHTSATLMYMYVKKDTLLLKSFLGHESIASTQIYTHIHDIDLKEAIKKNPLSNI
jgi:site-specific recombinase XerD